MRCVYGVKWIECGSKGTIAARAEILPSLVSGLEVGQTAAKFKTDETPLSNLGPKSPSFRSTDKYNFGCGRSYELRCLFKGREGAKAENGMRTSVCSLVLVKREKMRQVKKKKTSKCSRWDTRSYVKALKISSSHPRAVPLPFRGCVVLLEKAECEMWTDSLYLCPQ